jgi:hypothetical protein
LVIRKKGERKMKISNYVNEEKRVCVVVISDCENDVRRRVAKLVQSQFGEDIYFRGNNSYLNGPFRGKARCAPDDEFNPETGLAIARARAFQKYGAAYNREIDYLIERLDNLAENLEDFYRDESNYAEDHYPENQ